MYKNIYNSEEIMVDYHNDGKPEIRVSQFKDNHFRDEHFVELPMDVVEVVRCKDCKHCKKYRNRLDPMLNRQLCVRLDTYGWGVDEDDFCSYGERRTEDAV